MERWGWGRKKVKLFLNFLESQKMIERNANNKRTAITIVNYGFYQDCDLEKEQQKNIKGTAKEQRRDSTGTAKEHKQERKKERMKEYIDTDVSIKQHSIQSIIDAWNQLEPYGIKMIYRINPGSKRCTSLIALLEQFGEEKVIQAVDKVKQSDFLQGKTDTRFSLNFDWFINPNNFVKVLEGKYDERHDKKPATKNNNNFERRHYDMADISMRAKLRGLKNANGDPLFKQDLQGSTQYALDGSPMNFPNNGAFDKSKALMISGDFSQLVYSIRQDITFKLFTEGVVQNTDGTIAYNLMQNDMVALRAVMRLGWEIPNPINSLKTDKTKRCPFAVLKSGE